jgi:hypothetical protein
MGIRIVVSCSVQERIPSIANTMATKGTNSFHLRRAIPTALRPYKQGSWGGSSPGVAWWRHGSRPGCHTVSIAGEDGTQLDTRWIARGEQADSRRDLDNHGLPLGCETLVRRREKTDRTGDIRR